MQRPASGADDGYFSDAPRPVESVGAPVVVASAASGTPGVVISLRGPVSIDLMRRAFLLHLTRTGRGSMRASRMLGGVLGVLAVWATVDERAVYAIGFGTIALVQCSARLVADGQARTAVKLLGDTEWTTEIGGTYVRSEAVDGTVSTRFSTRTMTMVEDAKTVLLVAQRWNGFVAVDKKDLTEAQLSWLRSAVHEAN